MFISHFRDEISDNFGFDLIENTILFWSLHLNKIPNIQVDLKPLLDDTVNDLMDILRDIQEESKLLEDYYKSSKFKIGVKKEKINYMISKLKSSLSDHLKIDP